MQQAIMDSKVITTAFRDPNPDLTHFYGPLPFATVSKEEQDGFVGMLFKNAACDPGCFLMVHVNRSSKIEHHNLSLLIQTGLSNKAKDWMRLEARCESKDLPTIRPTQALFLIICDDYQLESRRDKLACHDIRAVLCCLAKLTAPVPRITATLSISYPDLWLTHGDRWQKTAICAFKDAVCTYNTDYSANI